MSGMVDAVAQSLPPEILEIILSDAVATVIPEERPWTRVDADTRL